MAAEQVAQPFPFGQARHHPVESSLQPPDFGAFEHADGRLETAVFDLGHRVDDFASGSEMDRDVRIIAGRPSTTAATATTRIGVSTDAVLSMTQPLAG